MGEINKINICIGFFRSSGAYFQGCVKYTLKWCSNPYHSDSQIIVPRVVTLTSPRTLLEMQILNLTPDLLSQKLVWSQLSILSSRRVILMCAKVWESMLYTHVWFNSPSSKGPPMIKTKALCYRFIVQSEFRGIQMWNRFILLPSMPLTM